MKSYEEQIKELKEQLAWLEAKLKESKEIKVKRWKPESQQAYWFVGVCGITDCNNWLDDETDEYLYLTHNCFKTQKEAEEHGKEIETYFKFKNYCEEHGEPLDWNINQQKKCFYYCNSYSDAIEIDANVNHIVQGVIYASNEQILRDAIDYIGGEEVAKRYLFGIKE